MNPMLRRAAMGLAALLVLEPVASMAQPAAPAAPVESPIVVTAIKDALEIQTIRGARLLGSGSPNDRAGAALTESSVQIETVDGEERLSLAVGITLQKAVPVQAERPGFYKLSRTVLGLVASAPLDADKLKGGLFSGDSLVSGTKAKISITHLSNELGTGVGSKVFESTAYELCIREATRAWQPAAELRAQSEVMIRDVRASVDLVSWGVRHEDDPTILDTDKSFDVLMRRFGSAPDGSLGKFAYDQCSPGAGRRFGNSQQLLAAYGDLDAFRNTFLSNRSNLRFFGADASIGSKAYQYIDRAAFKLADTNKTSWEVGAYAGLLNRNLTFSARARVVYGREVTLPDEDSICHTVPGETEEHCVTGPGGPPVGKNSGLASVETRHILSIGPTSKIALAPQFAYRFEDDEFGAELPIYLAPDENGKLSGGIKLAYASKQDDFSVGLFVGVPFSMFYQ